MVILCDMEHVSQESVQVRMSGAEVHMLQSSPYMEIHERFQTYAQQMFDWVKTILERKETGKTLIQLVVSAQGEQKLLTGSLDF